MRFYTLLIHFICTFFLCFCQTCEDNENEKYFCFSVFGMVKLLDTERKLIEITDQNTNELQKKADVLKGLVKELKAENDKSISDPEKYLSNPLNGFSLIRRMYNNWINIEKFINKPVSEIYLKQMRQYYPKLPSYFDLLDAVSALHRLQYIYHFKPSDICNGLLDGNQYNVKLKSIDSFLVGYYLFETKKFFSAGLWLNSSIMSYEDNNFNRVFDFGLERVKELYDKTLKERRSFLKNKDEEVKELPKKAPLTSLYSFCREDYANVPTKLYCFYNTTASPFLSLAPIKTEILHLNPYIGIFHDVITDEEIEHLKKLGGPHLVSDKIADMDRENLFTGRTIKHSLIHAKTSNVTRRIFKRVNAMTGIYLDAIQLINYGLVGQYKIDPSTDPLMQQVESEHKEHKQVINFVLYLSNEKQGGATVFPNLHMKVFPPKGSALMFYNEKLEDDSLLEDIDCPVIVGSKWRAGIHI